MIGVAERLRQYEIFLTGANGFLGKVLLGMLLDRYPDFAHLHVLVRPRRGVSAQARFASEVLGSPALAPLVGRIAEKYGEDFLGRKITVWPGDVGEASLGLEPESLERLKGRVGAVINCAGLVEFFPPVDDCFRSNVDGVENVVAFVKALGAKCVHISTCYVCGARDGLVEETEPVLGYYPRRKAPADAGFNHAEEIRYVREQVQQIYDSAAGAADSGNGESREITERLVALGRQRAASWGWVNTYTYAKSLGEQVIAAEKGLEYAIVRPGIVECALRFPFPGWIEGGRTSTPLVLMALGGMKDWPVRQDTPLEVVPVDLVASAILVVTALVLDGRAERVYQLGSADVNPIHLGPLVELLNEESRSGEGANGLGRAPFVVRRLVGERVNPRVRFVSADQMREQRERLQKRIGRAEKWLARTHRMLGAARLPGRESLVAWSTALRAMGLQASFRDQTLEQYLPFVLHNRYIFESENIRAAYAEISERDRQLLPWDPERIQWKAYWINQQVPGIRKWIRPESARSWTFRA